MGAERAARDAARIGHGDKQLEVDEVKTHGVFFSLSAFVIAEGSLNDPQIVP